MNRAKADDDSDGMGSVDATNAKNKAAKKDDTDDEINNPGVAGDCGIYTNISHICSKAELTDRLSDDVSNL